ncbi:MAG: hypothetical protein EOP37_21730 [Rubrivivax sp.]|nr:MAG: hypothetical protein EOP37_21730 [Rubrivivax sp.]
MPTFDPWNDAEKLGRQLAQTDSELLVVIGAEGWCEKCRRLRPAFEAMCHTSMPAHVAWFWLDLEDHHEFLGEFVPPDLPLLLRWRQGVCVQAAIVEGIDLGAPQAERVKLQSLVIQGTQVRDPHEGGLIELPRLWTEFATMSWASDPSGKL